MKRGGCTLDCFKTNLTLLRTFDGALFVYSMCVCGALHRAYHLQHITQ